MFSQDPYHGSNNTNKYNPQELIFYQQRNSLRSNNTNKYNPQERHSFTCIHLLGSNNTNKYNPQELSRKLYAKMRLK